MMNNDVTSERKIVLPPVILLIAVVAMIGLHFIFPCARWHHGAWRLVGGLLIAGGFFLAIWANVLFRKANTEVNPRKPSTSLVLDGPYRFTRNPMYLGMVLLLIGIALMLGSLTPWLVIPVFVWHISRRVIAFEERKLEAAFGSEYLDFKDRVRRWL